MPLLALLLFLLCVTIADAEHTPQADVWEVAQPVAWRSADSQQANSSDTIAALSDLYTASAVSTQTLMSDACLHSLFLALTFMDWRLQPMVPTGLCPRVASRGPSLTLPA